MIDIYECIIDFKNTNNFENIYYFYERYIIALSRRYNIEEYHSSLMWSIPDLIDT